MGIDGSSIAGSKKQQTVMSAKRETKKTPAAPGEKSLPLAIGLNFILPGVGYMYLGRPFLGVLAMIVVGFVLFTAGIFLIGQVWIGLNVIMAVDMLIIAKKRTKEILDVTTTTCPQCAETIKKEALVCRFCQYKLH